MSRKKIGIIIGIVALIAVGAVAGFFALRNKGGVSGNSADKVYVEKVSSVMKQNSGINNSFGGIVEPQETSEVNKDDTRTIKEVLVAVGDEVTKDQVLFSYDTSDLQLQIDQANLELESIANEISNYGTQIVELQKEKAAAPAEQQFEYTTQIQTLQTSSKQAEFNKKSKQAEIAKVKKSMENSSVVSKIDGVVKSINENGVDSSGNTAAYMTILATGEYRVKGTIDETSIGVLSEGNPVIVKSRIDETQKWNGTITKIDTDTPESNDNNGGYVMNGGDGGDAAATKYAFYVTLDSTEGLMLGQHLYIEPDYGQTETVEKEGLWLFGYYIVQDDEDPYVWAANGKNKLEKKKVELGEYDEALDEYEILSGLSGEDLIAFPMQGLYEGVKTVTNSEEVDYSAPLYNQESTEGGMDDGIMSTEMPLDDGMDENIMDTEIPAEGGTGTFGSSSSSTGVAR